MSFESLTLTTKTLLVFAAATNSRYGVASLIRHPDLAIAQHHVGGVRTQPNACRARSPFAASCRYTVPSAQLETKNDFPSG